MYTLYICKHIYTLTLFLSHTHTHAHARTHIHTCRHRAEDTGLGTSTSSRHFVIDFFEEFLMAYIDKNGDKHRHTQTLGLFFEQRLA